MGLDWVCLPKKKGENVNIDLLEQRLDGLNEKLGENFREFCASLGEDVPMVYPNELSAQFDSLPSTVEIRKEGDEIKEQIDSHLISPEETINAPKVGIDAAADLWIRESWDWLNHRHPETGKEMNIEEYIEVHKGTYVVEASNSPGVASVSGIAVSATSFRGKVIGYVDWLSEGLKGSAYNDMDPDELVAYGEGLLQEANDKEFSHPKSVEEGENDPLLQEINMVKDAGNWCVFWGRNGHSMHAWY